MVNPQKEEERRQKSLIQYYEEAGPDYGAWSKKFNMHFGYYSWPMNPFAREAMLEEMNRMVLQQLKAGPDQRLLDMGCGLGAPARSIQSSAGCHITAISIVPWQIESARKLTAIEAEKNKSLIPQRIDFLQADYTETELPAGQFDAGYAIESSCHAAGPAKLEFLREASRLLKPGARLVVADGFLKRPQAKNPIYNYCLKKISLFWELENFAHLTPFLDRAARDFEIHIVRDISLRIAPSVMHVPWVTFRFLLKELLLERKKLTRKRWNNALAPFLGIVVGLFRENFGYYMITMRKKKL